MCTFAPRAAAVPGFGGATAAFLDRQRGVVAAAAMAPSAASSQHKTREPIRRAGRAAEVSTAPAQKKRGRHDDGFDVVVDHASSSAAAAALRVRMDKELVALQGLLKRAKLLPRSSAPRAEKKSYLPPPQSKAQITATAANSKQQQRSVQRVSAKNPIAPEVPNNKQRPAAAKQQHSAVVAKTEVPKKRPPEEEEKEVARAAAREEFRQMLVKMEKSALADWTVYPEELEELGIPFEFVVTRTWKQAWLEYHAKKMDRSS